MRIRVWQNLFVCIFIIYLIRNVLSQFASPNILTDHSDLLEIGLYKAYFKEDDTLEFQCYIPGDCDQKNDFMDIYDEETKTVLQKTDCKSLRESNSNWDDRIPDRLYVPVSMNITNDSRLFGKLHCRLRKNGNEQNITTSKNFIHLPFLLCGSDSDTCLGDSSCDSDQNDLNYCLVNKTGAHSCAKKSSYDPKLCDGEKFSIGTPNAETETDRYCPVGEIGFCRSYAKDLKKIWYRVWTAKNDPDKPMHTIFLPGDCRNNSEAPLSYKGKPILYNEAFLLDLNDQRIKFSCSEKSPFFNADIDLEVIRSIIRNEKSYIYAYHYMLTCANETVFDLAKSDMLDTLNAGAVVYDMVISGSFEKTSLDEQKTYFTFRNKIVAFGTRISISSVGHKYKCEFTSPIGEEFLVTTWWEKNGTDINGTRINQQTFRGENILVWHMQATVPTDGTIDQYRCHAKVVYKTCSPHRRFEKTFESDWAVATNSVSSFLSFNFVLILACITVLTSVYNAY